MPTPETNPTSTESTTEATTEATTGHLTDPTRPAGSTRRTLAFVLAVAVAVGAALAVFVGPNPRLGHGAERQTGDPALIAQVESLVGDGRGLSALSAARVEAGEAPEGTARYAGFGDVGGDPRAAGDPPTSDTPFELGSITKVFTGMLLADAVERGEAALTDPLSQHLPELAGTPAGGVTLEALAMHTSGLPRLPADMTGLAGLGSSFAPGNPYEGWTTEGVIDAAATATLTQGGQEEYSNFGTALLGDALARAAGSGSYAELLTNRLLTPLGMESTTIVPAAGAEPAGLATPRTVNGRVMAPWTGAAFAGAGTSTRTTAADLTKLASALLDGSAPGADSMTPRPGPDGTATGGLGWAISERDGRTITWHNGGTGGTHTMLALDRDAGRAGIALATTDDRLVDSLGMALATDAGDVPGPGLGPLGLVSLIVAPITLLVLLVRLLRPRQRTRIGLATASIDALIGLVLVLVAGPWAAVPAWALGALAGGLGGAIVCAGLLAARSPNLPEKGRISAFVSLAISLILLVALAWVLW